MTKPHEVHVQVRSLEDKDGTVYDFDNLCECDAPIVSDKAGNLRCVGCYTIVGHIHSHPHE